MATKLIAFAALLEYAFVRPYIIPNDLDGNDFIGYSLVVAIFSLIGEANLKGLSREIRKAVLLNGLMGGLVGNAWLMVYLRQEERCMHHLLIANFLALAGVLCGRWNEMRKKKRTRWN